MASSIIHLAVTCELIKRFEFSNTDRLKFGSILPDAGQGKAGHLNKFIWGRNKKSYDFEFFRNQYEERMKSDDLYLGYYLHLVQDSLYRQFVYDRYHWNPMLPGNVERLHKDYQIVNQYIISRYSLKNDIVIPDGFDNEDLNQISSFDTAGLIKKLEEYFLPVEEEPVFFFTKEMSDEFIGEALAFCHKEVEKLRRGEAGIDMLEYAWNRAGM